MPRSLVAALAVTVSLSVAACGGSKQDDPLEPKAVAATGAVVDAPRSWEVNVDGKISYRVGLGPGRQVFLNEIMFPAASADELYAAECARARAPGTKETTPAGALFVQCQVTSTTRDGKTVELTKVASQLRIADKGVKCHFGTPDDPAKLAAICRSLRAKPATGR